MSGKSGCAAGVSIDDSKNPKKNDRLSLLSILFLFEVYQSTRMLQQYGILKHGENILSEELSHHVLQKFAEQQANLTQKQRRMRIKYRFRVFLWTRLLGKQSSQPCQMIKPHVLHYLMTKRSMCVIPSSILKKQHEIDFSWLDENYVLYHPSGFEYNSRNGWIHSSCDFKQITTHPCKPFIAITDSDGRVYIGKVDDPTNLFVLIHQLYSDESNCATICAFHPFDNYIAVGVPGYVIVYKFSESSSHSLSCKMFKIVRFFQEPGFCARRPRHQLSIVLFYIDTPKYPPHVLYWNYDGNSFTAVSSEHGNISKKIVIDFENPKADVCEFSQGYLDAFLDKIAPISSCMSPDGTSVATGYLSGQISINCSTTVSNPLPNPLTKDLKINSILPADFCSIRNIGFDPCDPSILAIQFCSRSHNGVHLLKISPDGLKILHSFLGTMNFQFYGGMFLLLNGNMITFFRLNGENLPVKLTDFTSEVGRIRSFCLTTLNDVVNLWYSSHSDSKLHKAELTLK